MLRRARVALVQKTGEVMPQGVALAIRHGALEQRLLNLARSSAHASITAAPKTPAIASLVIVSRSSATGASPGSAA
jgi:hypothetical protein